MGDLLELGSQRDMEPYYMVCLRSLPPCAYYKGLEREKGCLCCHLWVFINHIPLLGRKFCPARSACLCIVIKERFLSMNTPSTENKGLSSKAAIAVVVA